MKNNLMLLFLFLSLSGRSQNFTEFIRQHALEIDDDAIFKEISAYKCLMIGEMHGTKESAEFVTTLTELSVRHGRKVVLGLEIPSGDMLPFTKKPTPKNLIKTWFFKTGYGDGRNSAAWFQLIVACNKLPGVKFCFFDATVENSQNRDSLMFSNLIKDYRQDTSRLLITLSGNIHNKIKPYKYGKTMGCYLADYFPDHKVMAINHLYGSGTVYNRTTEGLNIREITGQTGIFTTATPWERYFLPSLPPDFPSDYTAIFYTRTITASGPVLH